MKKILVKLRTSLKFFVILGISTFLILTLVNFVYKPIYSVTLDGNLIGYCKEKSKLQTKIDKYMEKGDGTSSNIAYIQINELPEYEMCLLKRGIVTNDDEIFEKIKSSGTAYYKYYAILEDNEEKAYVSDFKTAETVVEQLKEKDSSNIDNIQILEKYETELASFVTSEEAVASLYKEKVVVPKVTIAKKTTSNTNYSTTSSNGFSTSSNISKSGVSLGVSLIKPVTGVLSSRFGAVSRIRSSVHTGLDIATSSGTPIKAAAGGTVTFAGYKGSYGNLVVITHSNGVQTYYGHCSKLYVSSGQTVSQGQSIAAVGSTGNSTGPHLHFEIRVNGVAYNPQNYVY